jgi:hypothetical protein
MPYPWAGVTIEDITQRELARQYGLSQTGVYLITKGTNWKHLAC